MRKTHGWVATALVLLILSTNSAVCAPRKIVSTFLCTDEYVWRLVPHAHIAALSFEASDRHPVVSTIADAVAREGVPAIRPSAEAVLTFKPDLVVMYAGTMPELHAQLARTHVKVLDVPWANSLADVRDVTTMLGEALDARDRAKSLLAEMDRKIADAKAHALRPPVKTLIYEPNGYSSAGGMTDEIMGLAGLKNLASHLRPTRLSTVSVEMVIARAPELVILSGDPQEQNSRAYLVQHHPALRALNGSSVTAWAQLTPLLCPGPWSLDAAETFSRLGAKARVLAHPKARS
jgi:iron complex transport system substrate-binding protein